MKNPYEILGVPSNASMDLIKSAFRRLAKETHPDINGGSQQMTARFREIAEAYAILADPVQKKYWDSFNLGGSNQQQTTENRSYYSNARATAIDIENYIHSLFEEVKPYKEAAKKSAFIGMAWLIGGILVTFGSYAATVSNGGGTYFVAWGAILFGGIQAVRSFFNFIKINNAVTEVETKMWEIFN